MSQNEVIRFSKDIGNDVELATELRLATQQVPADAPFPAPVEAAWMVGMDNDYSFTREDYMAAIPTLKAMYDATPPSARSEGARGLVLAAGDEVDEGRISRAMGWEDGEAGAMCGSLILSYWDQNADNWGVASPDSWISGTINW